MTKSGDNRSCGPSDFHPLGQYPMSKKGPDKKSPPSVDDPRPEPPTVVRYVGPDPADYQMLDDYAAAVIAGLKEEGFPVKD